MKVDKETVYETPTRKGRISTAWFGSPMHVDGEDVGEAARVRKGLRKSISDLFGAASPMKVDRRGVFDSGSPQKPLPVPRFTPRYRGGQR
jgi:hypothetical protein